LFGLSLPIAATLLHFAGGLVEPPEIVEPLTYSCGGSFGTLYVDPVSGTAWFSSSPKRTYGLTGDHSVSVPVEGGTLMIWRALTNRGVDTYRFRIFSDNKMDLKTDTAGWCTRSYSRSY
jgi:hypothetical protein